MDEHDRGVEQPLDEWLEVLIARWMSGFKTKLLAGLAIIVPLWITFWALQTIFRWADGFSEPLVRRALGIHVPGLGLLLTFLILWFCGVLGTNVLGKRLLQAGKNLLGSLPVVRSIHGPIQQLLETFTSPDKAHFKRVVFVEYPRAGMWMLGFVSGDIPRRSADTKVHSVFIPTSPNPTSGFLVVAPPEQIRAANMGIEEAFQMIVSGGLVFPPSLQLDDMPRTPSSTPQ